MNEAIVKEMVELAKDTVKEAIVGGEEHESIFKWLSSTFGIKNARLILADLGLDRGLDQETRNYLNSFK